MWYASISWNNPKGCYPLHISSKKRQDRKHRYIGLQSTFVKPACCIKNLNAQQHGEMTDCWVTMDRGKMGPFLLCTWKLYCWCTYWYTQSCQDRMKKKKKTSTVVSVRLFNHEKYKWLKTLLSILNHWIYTIMKNTLEIFRWLLNSYKGMLRKSIRWRYGSWNCPRASRG